MASGGNDNHIYIWDSSKMSSSRSLHSFKDHSAAVKALAWCPYDSAVLASGGGTEDRCIKIWNVHKGTCICSIDTRAQARQTHVFLVSINVLYVIYACQKLRIPIHQELITAVLIANYLGLS